LALLGGSGLAQAYTRAYLTNNTGQTAYELHVVLSHAAKQGSAGSGDYTPIFEQQTVSADGMTLDFSNPLSPLGIAPGETVNIGWNDLDSSLSADIIFYYWTDTAGNLVGGIQYITPSGSGLPPGDLTSGGVFPSGFAQMPADGNGGTGNPPSGPSGPSGSGPTDNSAVPEPGGWVLMLGGLAACLAARSIRRRSTKSLV
jgi:hypothetical protein